MKRLLTIFSLCALVLGGCGFHLRGQVDLSPALSSVYIRSSDADLKREVAGALRAAGSEVPQSAEVASATLKLSNVDFQRQVVTVDSRGKATGFRLVYKADFEAAKKGGGSLTGKRTVRAARDYDFDSTQVLQKEGEEDFLRSDMERDAAQQIVRQLSTLVK